MIRVDPRVCGVAETRKILVVDTLGRSPRMRGSHNAIINIQHFRGSIPAYAG